MRRRYCADVGAATLQKGGDQGHHEDEFPALRCHGIAYDTRRFPVKTGRRKNGVKGAAGMPNIRSQGLLAIEEGEAERTRSLSKPCHPTTTTSRAGVQRYCGSAIGSSHCGSTFTFTNSFASFDAPFLAAEPARGAFPGVCTTTT